MLLDQQILNQAQAQKMILLRRFLETSTANYEIVPLSLCLPFVTRNSQYVKSNEKNF